MGPSVGLHAFRYRKRYLFLYWSVDYTFSLANDEIKLKILSEMANLETNPLARNWYLQEMNVVRDGVKPKSTAQMQTNLVKDHKIDNILSVMETRIDPVKALTDYAGIPIISFYALPSGYKILFKIDNISYHYHIRNGVMIRSLDTLENHDTGKFC